MRGKIHPGLCRLFVLAFSVDMVYAVPALEVVAGLMKMERDIVLDALGHGVQYPAEVADSGAIAGFPAAGDQFDFIMVLPEKRADVDGFK